MKKRLMIIAALALAAAGWGGVTTAADAIPVHGYAHLERVLPGLPCVGVGAELSPLTVFVSLDNENEPSNPVVNVGPTPTDECQL